MGDAWKSLSGLNLAPQTLQQLQREYVEGATALWNSSLQGLAAGGAASAASAAKINDRRFAAPEWAQNPAASYTAQLYLLNARTLTRLAEAVEGDAKTKARIRFAVQQWVDAMAPSNFLALNPEAQQLALKTQGQSLATGMTHLLGDAGKGHVSQTDESAFEVGRNVATTEGAVVFENELFQLIEYKPLTAKVHERPLLMVPPCINKFYIMDLQPENSLIRYAVEQGHRTFVVSWRNPDASLADRGWDDYIGDAAIRAIEVVKELGGTSTINTLGFCVGGTILATALAVLAARGEQPAESVTLLTTLLDFSETGILDVFIDEAAVRLREMTLGAQAPGGPQLLKGQELATTFSVLRPNDLVWNYVVANYLKGEAPPAFDLLYWNGDATNLPGPMYCWYLRHTYLQDELKQPGKLTVCGEKLDLGSIKAPVFIYASREDHIVPWKAAYASTRVMKGKKRFVLGASGHIAGVINPPAKKKRNYWTNDTLPAAPEAWFDAATEVPGSWWSDWTAWLEPKSGALVAAPKAPGNRRYKPIEAAPGRYVLQKA
ncbi:MAG TPA: class I poly(R)-hydroxyalkanoic acid synthase [Rubrivivax sp.]|nr:class I poly(R)-hydroxyalkanoic acid synthase [Rubrivivax sp.]